MNKLDLVAVITACSMPFAALGDDDGQPVVSAEPTAAESPQPAALEAFDPANPNAGTLPVPVVQAPSSPDVPKSALFYTLPFIGLWLILRRRHRTVGR